MTNRARAVLWDMDGTLIDSEPASQRVLEDAMRTVGIMPPHNLHERTFGVSAVDIHTMLVEEHGLAMALEEWEVMKIDALLRVMPQIGAFDDATAVWHALKARGVPQAVVSNSDRLAVDASLRRIGVSAPGLITVSRNDVVEGKPAAEPYLRGAHLLRVEPGEVIVVEDSEVGLGACLAAGMRPFIVPWADGALGEPSMRLRKMADLFDHVAGR
ncbi:MAG: HAD family phosphatase [Pseudomonadota bacterium]